MPLYEYVCTSCGITTEVIQSHGDEPLKICESCGGSLRKLLSSPAFQFKGTGWYASDYGKGSSAGTAAKSNGSDSGRKPDEGKAAEGAKPPDSPSPGTPTGGSGPPAGDGGKTSE